MPRRPSFRLRLVAGAAIWILLGLGASGAALYAIMRTYLEAEVAEELRHHAAELAGLVVRAPDGRLALRQELSDHRFFELGSGHYWQVSTPGAPPLRSASLGPARLPDAPPSASPSPSPSPSPSRAGEATADLPGPAGRLRLLEERIAVPEGGAPVRVAVAVDARVMDDLLAEFTLALALSLATIAIGLVVAVLVQVTYGLWPLHRIRLGLAAIRQGRANRLPDDLPDEVAPLAESLNAMIVANDDVVRRARTQAGNLAHALQTPLAVLMDEARRMQAHGQDGSLILREAERMRRHVEFHMAHARAAASRGRPHTAAPVEPALRGLLLAIASLQRGRDIDLALDAGPARLAVACEAEDLEEMAGNLIDNAFKWASGRVRVSAAPAGDGKVRIAVDDDGPGMPPDSRDRAFRAGERLDERVGGHGLGLAIVRDIAELYGGSVMIGDSDLGGARVTLELPASA